MVHFWWGKQGKVFLVGKTARTKARRPVWRWGGRTRYYRLIHSDGPFFSGEDLVWMDPEDESQKPGAAYHQIPLTPGNVSWVHLSERSSQRWLEPMVYSGEK